MASVFSLRQFIPNSRLCRVLDILAERSDLTASGVLQRANIVAFPEGMPPKKAAEDFFLDLKSKIESSPPDWLPSWISD